VECEEEDKSVLFNLLQLYLYDFSPKTGDTVNRHGLFGYKWLDHYWTDDERRAYLMYWGETLAGFALKNQHSRLGDEGIVSSIAEFFVLRGLRGYGIGRAAAISLFELYPGRWEVSQISVNIDAHRFWTRVIDDYTAGNYELHTREDDRWRRWIHAFDTPMPIDSDD
jgi:predicted acetyltransferase